MTRTGKSNTVKKVIEATTEASQKATKVCLDSTESATDNLKAFDASGAPKFKVKQIIFDIKCKFAI